MDTSTVADSTDWLSTPLSGLAPLESSLRCQVCKDFFTTPMITTCSHTFCSLCIRRYLSQEGRCPACREPDQEMKLRRNWVVEELVATFTASRKAMLDYVRDSIQKSQDEIAGEKRRSKRRKTTDTREPSNGNVSERRSTRSQTKRIVPQSNANQQTPISTQSEVADSDEGSAYEDANVASHHFDGPSLDPSPTDGLVACPSCSRRMKESLINAHLDKCLSGEASLTPTPPSNSPQPPQIISGTIAYTQTKPSSTTTRLPTLNYSLFTESTLRRKLKDFGIPNTGTKELLKRRHTEWINLWNANCDSLNPVTKLQLLKDLTIWERTLGRQVEKSHQGPNGVMVKDFDRDRYAKKQKGEFDDLIARAKRNRPPAKTDIPKVPAPPENEQQNAPSSFPSKGEGFRPVKLPSDPPVKPEEFWAEPLNTPEISWEPLDRSLTPEEEEDEHEAHLAKPWVPSMTSTEQRNPLTTHTSAVIAGQEEEKVDKLEKLTQRAQLQQSDALPLPPPEPASAPPSSQRSMHDVTA